MDGPRLVAAVVAAAGAGLVVARLLDAVLPAPRLAHDVPYGLLAVLAGTVAGAAAGAAVAAGARQLSPSGGALLGAVVAALATLLAIGVGYIAGTVGPRPAAAGGLAFGYLGVGLPLAFAAPVGYLVALSVAG